MNSEYSNIYALYFKKSKPLKGDNIVTVPGEHQTNSIYNYITLSLA